MRLLAPCVALVLSLSLVGCGSGGGGTTAPTPAAVKPTITTSNSMIYIGQTITFQATGSGPITWGGDSPSVATVDGPTGRVTGAGIGTATIWAENSGGRTTRLLRGLPSFAGSWAGNYAITGCQSTGDFTRAGFCGIFPMGAVLNMNVGISQSDDQVTGGAFALGGNVGALNSAVVDQGGVLPITGTTAGQTGSTTIVLDNARWRSDTAGTITGSFDQTWGTSGLSGFGRFNCQIRAMTRTSGGPAGFSILPMGAPAPAGITLDELLRRLRVGQ